VKRLALITVILGSALALVSAASARVLLDGGSSGGSGALSLTEPAIDPAIQTVLRNADAQMDPAIQTVLRNSKERAASVQLEGKALAAYYDTGAVVTSQPEVPMTARQRAAYYDTGAVVQPLTSSDTSTISSTASSSSDSTDINWSALTGAILLGLLLVGMAATAVTRRRHQPSF